MDEDSIDYTAAERRLLDALAAGTVCDFADGTQITDAEMASWGPERTVRAALLRRLLTAEGYNRLAYSPTTGLFHKDPA